jgi:hypothetical protein
MENEYCETEEPTMCERCNNSAGCCMIAPKRIECDNFYEGEDEE